MKATGASFSAERGPAAGGRLTESKRSTKRAMNKANSTIRARGSRSWYSAVSERVAYSQAMVEVRAENPALSERVERFYLSEDDLSDRAMARALFWAEVARAMRVNVISEREAVGLVARNSEGLYRSAFSS